MKITAGPVLLVCIGMLTNSIVGLAQAENPEPAGQGDPAAPAPTAYIRPLDKLRTELSEQQALLETVVDITAKIAELRNQDSRSDFLVLFDEDLSQAERIKAVLSDSGHARSDELAVIREEIEFLKSMYIQTLQMRENIVAVTIDEPVIDEPVAWTLGPSSIEYVQAADGAEAGFVSLRAAAGNQVVMKANESVTIAGKTILLDSVKLGPDGRILIQFVVNGDLKTVYYPQ